MDTYGHCPFGGRLGSNPWLLKFGLYIHGPFCMEVFPIGTFIKAHQFCFLQSKQCIPSFPVIWGEIWSGQDFSKTHLGLRCLDSEEHRGLPPSWPLVAGTVTLKQCRTLLRPELQLADAQCDWFIITCKMKRISKRLAKIDQSSSFLIFSWSKQKGKFSSELKKFRVTRQ